MAFHVLPPSVERCHCSVGVGVPLAATVKAAALPVATDWFVGWIVIAAAAGAAATVSSTAALLTLPALLLTTTRKRWPVIETSVTPES